IYLLSALGIVSSLFLLNKEDKKINLLLVSGNAIILSGIVAPLGRANLAIALLILFSSLLLKLIDIKSTTLIIILAAIVSFISFQNNSGEVTQRIESPASLSDRRSEEHTSELQSRENLVCRLLLEKKNTTISKV